MVDEKQSPPDPEDDTAKNAAPGSPWDDSAADDAAAGELASEPGGELSGELADMETSDTQAGKRRGGWGSLAALGVLVLLAVGLYLAWPILQPRLLALLPPAASQTLEAVKALDHRVAQLEAANAQLDQTVAAIKSAMDSFSRQMDELSQGLPGGEVLAAMGEKFTVLEQALAQLGQQAGENGAAALAALVTEVDGLKARLGSLADGPANDDTGAVGEQVAALSQQSTALSQQSTALAEENKALRQNLAALEARLGQLEQTVRQTAQARQKAGAGEGLVLALGQLRQTVLSGAPYAAPLAAVSALAGDDAALTAAARALAPWAGAGVVTVRALSDQFPAMARAVLRANSGETDGFWRRTLHRVTSLVTVRRVGEVEGMEADAVLARAERRLGAGELAAATALIAGLDGPAGTAAMDWLGRAQARLAALAALAQMQSQAIAGLADG